MKKHSTFHKVLLFALVSLFALPWLEGKLNVIKVKALHGVLDIPNDTSFTWKGWFAGKYQEHETRFLNDSFGFRNVLVRLNNQLDFSLFNRIPTHNMVIGKQGYMFGLNQLKAYNGEDFIGEDSIRQRLEKAKFLQDTLKKLHRLFLIVYSPGKAFYYPEFIPDSYKQHMGKTNYACYVETSKQLGLYSIDLNQYFLGLKNSAPYPLFPKYGVHWSIFGAFGGSIYLISSIEKICRIALPQQEILQMQVQPATGTDADAEKSLNLLFDIKPKQQMAYPTFRIYYPKNPLPSALFISDSFFLAWANNAKVVDLFGQGTQEWDHGDIIYPASNDSISFHADQSKIKEEFLKHDIIIIMATDFNLPDFGWGTIEKAYEQFHKKN